MKLTDNDMEDFEAAYSSDWGEHLSPEEARVLAQRLVHHFSLLSKLRTGKSLAESQNAGYPEDDATTK